MVIVLSSLIIILDQITKRLAIEYLKNKNPLVVIENFFKLNYVENKGAAFGILQGRQFFFFLVTLIVVTGLIIFIYKNYYDLSRFMKVSLAFILGGAIGNFIDRIYLGYVVDFLSFEFFGYTFPSFNVADSFIVIGTFFLILIIIKLEE